MDSKVAETAGLHALVVAAVEGDEAAWCRLVRRFAPLVEVVIRRMNLSEADREDAVSLAWERAYRRLDTVQDAQKLPGWLATVARRAALEVIRTRRRHPYISFDAERHDRLDGSATEPDTDLLANELRAAIHRALGSLPPQRRNLLCEVFAPAAKPYADIAQRLGIRVGSIGPTRQRSLACLARVPQLQELR